MRLPFAPPLAPMLSSAADALPDGDGWQFEPKWDGFRTLVFRDGDEILLQSRDEKPMNRYFPELVAPLAAALPERCVVDGEIVIVGAGGLDFEALLLRIHPAASRVKLLAAQSPASFVAWDLLALGDEDLREAPLADAARAARAGAGRRGAAGAPLAGHARSRARRGLVPPLRGRRARRRHGQASRRALPRRRAHDDQGQARAHGRLRGRRLPLAQERRRARWSARSCSASTTTTGTLHHVGVTAAFTNAVRKQLVAELAPLRENALEGHPWRDWAEAQEEASAKGQRLPGATSRWNRGKDLSWEPLRPERVCEVAYDHMQGDALPARRAVRALAPRQAPAGLPLRSAGGHAGLRAGARLRRARPRAAAARAAPGIVVGIGRLLGRALGLGDVAQVDADARPRGRAAAHRVDEDVVHLRAAPRPPGWRAFQRSRPASASSLCSAFATVMSGCVDCRRPCRSCSAPAAFRRDGATRGGSSPCFL